MTLERFQIMLVDDHAVVRTGLKTLLEVSGAFAVVAEASSVAEAITVARQVRPQLVVMDVRLPDGSGIDACRTIRAELPETRIVMLTSYAGDQAAVAALTAGASGYLLKEISEESILESLKMAARGGMLMSSDVVARALSGPRPGDLPRLTDLNSQEQQILHLISAGRTNREIGEAIHLSEHTVRNYVSRLLEKLGMSRRSEAAAFVARQGRE